VRLGSETKARGEEALTRGYRGEGAVMSTTSSEERKAKQWVREMRLLGGPCVLCRRHTHNVGIFVPDNSVAWGAPGGKQRIVLYPYCGCGGHSRATLIAIEARLAHELLAKLN